ncbi:MAG: DUF4143 domain-containing protein [Candidatus Dojkabacteria bacterium]
MHHILTADEPSTKPLSPSKLLDRVLVYGLYPFSQNSRDEIGKTPKIYFHNLGLRNAIIGNFDTSVSRSDLGAMFENFIISEVQKSIAYQNLDYKINYWRLKRGTEVDLVLYSQQELYGVELKLQKGKVSSSFTNRCSHAHTRVVTKGNFY